MRFQHIELRLLDTDALRIPDDELANFVVHLIIPQALHGGKAGRNLQDGPLIRHIRQCFLPHAAKRTQEARICIAGNHLPVPFPLPSAPHRMEINGQNLIERNNRPIYIADADIGKDTLCLPRICYDDGREICLPRNLLCRMTEQCREKCLPSSTLR